MPKIAISIVIAFIAAAFSLADSLSAAKLARDVHPQMKAYRVPDGTMRFEDNDAGWNRLRSVPGMLSEGPDKILFHIPSRGAITGPQDLSMKAWAAYDSSSLYILADVHDSELFSQCDAANPWLGDDFEVYVDANDPAQQFASGLNENDGHYTFIGARINAAFPRGFLYQAGECPGIRFASSLRSFGYTIEVAIPKRLLPNWKAHPDLPSIGFDLQATDVDSPGLIGHDAAEKSVLFLLSPSPHFQSPAKLGSLVFDGPSAHVKAHSRPPAAAIAALGGSVVLYAEPGKTVDELADAVLAKIDDFKAGDIATRAVESGRVALVRAGAEVYALRPALPMSSHTVSAFNALTTPKGHDPEDGPYAYILYALAARHELKVEGLYAKYTSLSDPALKLTMIWCLGLNGDKAALPDLVRAYPTATGEMQQRIAWSLAMMGDRTGIAVLQDAAKNDSRSLWGKQCIALVAKLGG